MPTIKLYSREEVHQLAKAKSISLTCKGRRKSLRYLLLENLNMKPFKQDVRPPYWYMVLTALYEFKTKASIQAILKYLLANYSISNGNSDQKQVKQRVRRYINKALPQLLEKGLIKKPNPLGRSYRITADGRSYFNYTKVEETILEALKF